MPSQLPPPLLRIKYEEAAEAYLRSLPPEHFMEATAQATQRKITLESLDLVTARRPEVQVFNELLVQYPHGRQQQIRQVVPDNMVVVYDKPIKASGSFDVPFQPAAPLVMLEYVSKHNKRKDYDDNMQKYERELRVPYYLLFYPDAQELTLYRYGGRKYATVKPNERGRLAIPELELEVALLDEWVRYWFRGELLSLPGDLQRELDEARRQTAEANRRAEEAERAAAEARRQAEESLRARLAAEQEVERLRAELQKVRRNGNKAP